VDVRLVDDPETAGGVRLSGGDAAIGAVASDWVVVVPSTPAVAETTERMRLPMSAVVRR
jgi:hypothetical protein